MRNNLLAICGISAFAVFIYLFMIDLLLPNLTRWQFNTISIFYTAILSGIVGYMVLNRHRKMRNELSTSKRILHDVIDTIPVRTFWKDLDGIYLGCNQLFARDAGKGGPEEIIGDTDYNMGWAEQAELYRSDDRKVVESGEPKINYEEPQTTPEGETIWLNTSKIPLKNSKGNVYGILGTYEDITERKQVEEALAEANVIINRGPAVAFLWKNKDRWPVGFVSDNVKRLSGYSAQEFMEEKIFYSDIIHSDDYKRVTEEVAGFNQMEGKKSFEHEPYRIITKDKDTRWISDTTYIRRDTKGIITHYEGIVYDITDQKNAESAVREQLSEKEFILKEVHHRIKNNFASIGSLLSLQANSTTTPEVESALQDAIGRVNSMQILYDKLLLTENYQVTSVKVYLDNLIDDIINLFFENIDITVEKQIDDFKLDSKRLVSIGIIVNELLTNIMKYGFSDRASCLIEIIVKENHGKVSLIIQDNGRGLPEGFNISESKGFGLMLVNILSQQLCGNFTIENNNGTRSKLEFSI